MKDLWQKYKSKIQSNCTDPSASRNSVYYWQNRLFAASAIYLIPFSLFAIIPGIYMAYVTDLKPLLAVDALAIGSILVIAFYPRITAFSRKIIFNGMLYLVAFALLHYLGATGPGLLYLLAITIFVLLSLDRKYGYLALLLNTLICIYFSIAIHFGFAGESITGEYHLISWIAVSSNLIFLSGTAVFLIPKLFAGLQSVFEEQQTLSKKLENSVEELDEKNKELEQFAYTVSHDLKEPLRMVISFLGLLQKRYESRLDDKAKEYIHYATEGASRMRERIDDLLEYSRIGRKYTVMETVDLDKILEEVTEYVKSSIDQSGARIHIAQLPEVWGVPIAIKMLFQNLLTNALKYRSEENRPEIIIQGREKEQHWLISISDNGIGIDKKFHQQIFSVFERLHASEEYPGTGMGLAICKKIVEQHGGEIWVESEEGEGSTFYFTIEKV